MRPLERALQRLGHAIVRLEAAVDMAEGGERGVEGDAAEATALVEERDRLAGEVLSLRARADEDARLRGEAVEAVREALHDLRSAVGVVPEREARGDA